MIWKQKVTRRTDPHDCTHCGPFEASHGAVDAQTGQTPDGSIGGEAAAEGSAGAAAHASDAGAGATVPGASHRHGHGGNRDAHHHGHGGRGGHGHSHAHGGGHDHTRSADRRGLLFVLFLTGTFMFAELVGGLLSNSLALLADAAHMLTDVAAIGLSLFALWFARRPSSAEKTYGYLRWEILAALINGVTLVVLSLFIFWEAWERFAQPQDVEGRLMLGVAVGGLLVNILAAWVLHRSAGESLNVRGAYLHVLGDLLGSVGAIAAAVVILSTGWLVADPLISVAVGVLILISSWKLVRESVNVLLEATPAHIDLAEVRQAIDDIPGVDQVHDLHVWTVTSGFLAMSAHAVVDQPEENQRVLEEIHHRLRKRFGIGHITVQLERRAMHRGHLPRPGGAPPLPST